MGRPAVPSLPLAIARAGVGPRLVAWHAARGRRFGDLSSWTFRLAMSLALWHAATLAFALAVCAWTDSPSIVEIVAAIGLLTLFAGIAAGVQCLVILMLGLPYGWLVSRLTGGAGWLAAPLCAAACAIGVLAIEPTAAIVWWVLVGAGPIAAAQVAGATAIGALYGSWLPAIRADRA